MDFFVILIAIIGLIIFIGSILGMVTFFKMRKLTRELAKTRLEFSRYIVASETGGGEETPIADRELSKTSATYSLKIEKTAGSDIDRKTLEDASVPREPGKKQARNLEATIGSLWAVWVGGVALALGAIFLVKFSIENGLLGPGVRIALALAFSALLLALGEWGRRRGELFSYPGFGKANIPAIVTAAGTMGLFATIFAAYELYNMLPTMLAFLALGLVGVATTFAALLHGPMLAALGLLGSFLAPFLVSTDAPSVAGLAIYVLFVAWAAFGVGRLRLWKWHAIATAIGLICFGVVLSAMTGSGDRLYLAGYLIASWVSIAYVFFISLYEKSAEELHKHDLTGVLLLSAIAGLGLFSTLLYDSDFLSGFMLVAIVAGPMGLAYYYSSARVAIYTSMFFAGLGYFGWSLSADVALEFYNISDIATLLTSLQIREGLSTYMTLGLGIAGVAMAISYFSILNSPSRSALSIGGVFIPLLLICANYLRVSDFSSAWSYAFVALLLFTGYLFVANYLARHFDKETIGGEGTRAAFGVGAFVALALCASFILEKSALTVALALLVTAIAWVNTRLPMTALRVLTAFATLLWIGRILWDPRIVNGDIGSTPIFNWLTFGYGGATLAFGIGAWLLGREKRDKWLEAVEAVTLASFIATLALVSLHALDPSQIFTAIDTLEEVAMMTIISGGVALGLLRLRRTQSSFVLNKGVTLLGFAGMFFAGVGLLIFVNPWFTGDSFGSGLILNGLLLAYFATSLLFLLLGWFSRGRRSKYYVNSAFLFGSLLGTNWVNLTIRHFYHPKGLIWGPTTSAELYTYSFVWLLIGIGVLAAGIYWRTKLVRLVSVGIIMLVVAKVFLIDMAGLEGILRAVSFIGLGATLIGIGLVYQRVLSRPDYTDPQSENSN